MAYPEMLQRLQTDAESLLSRILAVDAASWKGVRARLGGRSSSTRDADRLRGLDPAHAEIGDAQLALALHRGFGSWSRMCSVLRRICRGENRYYVEECPHIFSDGLERGVRLVYDRASAEIIAMQIECEYCYIERSTGRRYYVYEWEDAGRDAVEDVLDALRSNEVPEQIEDAARWVFPHAVHPRGLRGRPPAWALAQLR